MTLYPFQVIGVSNLTVRRAVLLGDEMGLGKTVQCATAVKILFEQESIRKVLVVCPSSLCLNWKAELQKWADIGAVIYQGSDRYGMLEGKAKILITSFETICNDLQNKTLFGEKFYDVGIDLLIIDEAQRIKDPDSIRAKILSKVVSARRWAISGTPLENHPRDLASILRFLEPNEYPDEGALDDIEKNVSLARKLLLRRTKAQVGLELPDKVLTYIRVPLEPGQAADYSQAREKLLSLINGRGEYNNSASILLKGIQELRRICVLSNDNTSSKIDFIEAEIEELVSRDEKVVIFSTFSNLVLPVAAERLSRFGALLYTGSMTAQEREDVHNRFISDPKSRVMCASLRAAGVGLTWTVANHVYHLDSWWNPQALNQADDRVHRIGQKRTVFIKRLIASDTIEEAIEELLLKKVDIFNLIFNSDPATKMDDDSLSRLISIIKP